MITASVVYFVYLAAVACVLPGLPAARRVRAGGAAAAGLALTAITAAASAFWWRDVVLPLLLLLTGYWASGLLWVGPDPRIERLLARFDAALNLPSAAARLPRPVCEVLELAYVGIYVLIPVALAVHLTTAPHPDAARFWSVILITDLVCFGMLPWIQTRPPRAIESIPPCRSTVRRLNLELLERTSIGVNTVPSGHAAEAMAIALVLWTAPPAVAIPAAAAALLVSAGAVSGRYHYGLDVLAGWLVAVAVFCKIWP